MLCLSAVFAKQNALNNPTKDMQKMDNTSNTQPHSADYFGETRSYWWNDDFLDLMAKNWQLNQVGSVLDVGCGVGHWGFTLARILPQDAQVTGVDMEDAWVKEARNRAEAYGLSHRYFYQQGDVNHLPFPDNKFDMVTCQTVLIHVPDIEKALQEMLRVLKPSGIMVLIEPSNIMHSLSLSTADMQESTDDIIDVAKFQLLCERGKYNLKEGYISIGDQLPGYLHKLGLKDIQIRISDKAKSLFPPYEGSRQQSLIEEFRDNVKKDFWIWNKENSKKYYLAGGGDPDKFEFYWKKALYRQNNIVVNGVQKGTFATAGGKVTYCISARKNMQE